MSSKAELRTELRLLGVMCDRERAAHVALRKRYESLYEEREKLRVRLARCHDEDHEGVIRLLRLRLDEQRAVASRLAPITQFGAPVVGLTTCHEGAVRSPSPDVPACTCLGLNNRASAAPEWVPPDADMRLIGIPNKGYRSPSCVTS